MPRIQYINKKFRTASRTRIRKANEIIKEYKEQGFNLTLRQLYYQFVARDLLPNTEKSYSSLGSLISDARLTGLIDWNVIEDRTRFLRGLNCYDSPQDLMNSVISSYHVDRWQEQSFRPEVWIEKDALVGVIEGVCNKFGVDYFSCRGYVSTSEMWRAGRRMQQDIGVGRTPVVIHLGDHDPSGLDMTRDITDRLDMFAESKIRVVRVALNMDQVKKYGPPPNPAKITDRRFDKYQEEYSDDSWELDALEPSVIADLIQTEIEKVIDERLFLDAKNKELEGKRLLAKVTQKWDDIIEFLEQD